MAHEDIRAALLGVVAEIQDWVAQEEVPEIDTLEDWEIRLSKIAAEV